MRRLKLAIFLLLLLASWGTHIVRAAPARDDVVLPNPGDIIAEINNLRASYGVPALATNPILMSVAQTEVNGIEAGQPPTWRPYGLTLGQWLIKDGYPLSGDLSQDGYRSENWALVNSAQGAIDQLHEWIASNDEAHMNTMLSQYRSDIGVGVAGSKNQYGQDEIYMVIETALRTGSGQQQGDAQGFLTSLPGLIGGAQSINGTPVAMSASGYIVPVALSTARPDGDVIHPVRSGQSLWSIAIHYGTTIQQIRQLNNLGADNTIYEGQKLLVKKAATQPSAAAHASATVTATFLPATPTPFPPTGTPSPTATPAAVSLASSNNPAALVFVLVVLIVLVALIVPFMRMKV